MEDVKTNNKIDVAFISHLELLFKENPQFGS